MRFAKVRAQKSPDRKGVLGREYTVDLASKSVSSKIFSHGSTSKTKGATRPVLVYGKQGGFVQVKIRKRCEKLAPFPDFL
jgi:hypothetical protein